MRAVVLRARERLSLEDWPRPSIAEGELLVRARACGLCGSDIAKIVAASPAVPAVLGHELVGDVVEVGEGVGGFRPGDRVVAAHHVPCGVCHYCRRGSDSMCRAFKASNLDPGGFAEYVRVPAPNVAHATFKLSPDVTDEAASFVEPLACCARALRRAGVGRDDTTVVAGLGSIGCLFVQLAKLRGSAVVGVDPLEDRARLAVRLGADRSSAPDGAAPLVKELSDGRGADHVIVTGGGAAVLPWAESLVRDGGAIHYFAGGGGDGLPLGLETLYHRELTLTATYSSSPADLADAFRLIATRAIATGELITHRVPLERFDEGLDLLRQRRALKVLVTP